MENVDVSVHVEAVLIKKDLREGFESVDVKLEAIYKMLDVHKRLEVLEKKFQQLERQIS